MFHNQNKISSVSHKESLQDLTKIVQGLAILKEAKRPAALKEIRSLCALEDNRYSSLCENLLSNLANYFQHLPETNNSFYTEAGGLLDHALYRTEAAMHLFNQFALLGSESKISEEQKLWQYALYSAALLQGAGKLYVDYSINTFDATGHMLALWNPLAISLATAGSYYNHQFQKDTDIDFRCRVNLLLARSIMPASGFSWIASNPKVLAVWLSLLQDDYRSAGTLGAILSRADALSIQRYFHELLLRNAALRSRQRQTGPFRPETPEVEKKEQLTGLAFIEWLKQALAEGRLLINQAPIFMVPGGMLISEEAYKLFIRENSEYKNWQVVQKSFLSLDIHINEINNGERFEETNTQKMHSGDVFVNYSLALPDTVKVHNITTGQTSALTAVELAFVAQFYSQFTQIQAALSASPLPHLSAEGLWQAPNNNPKTQFGASHRG